MCGTNGQKLPGIRQHMQRVIGDVYEGLDPSVIETWPADGVVDRSAFRPAAAAFKPGDCAIIFTPDDTHFEIAMACIERGMHVMITKPPVKSLREHNLLVEAAKKKGVLVVIELHKRFDPIYLDAADRIQGLGPFSYFTAYMSQPKHQLDTFKVPSRPLCLPVSLASVRDTRCHVPGLFHTPQTVHCRARLLKVLV